MFPAQGEHRLNAYMIALYVHFLSLLMAAAAAALAFEGALRVRSATTAPEALQTLGRIRKLTKLFPLATVGLLASGGYMTQLYSIWTAPWIVASVCGLALISVLGAGVEASRMRALARELAANGLSACARRLQSDPLAWTAKMGTLTLVLAVALEMTMKPGPASAAAILATALLLAVLAAVPFWAGPTARGRRRRPA
jgi:hypothetical protein